MTTSTSKTNKASLRDALRMVKRCSLIGLDLETTGLDPRRGEIRLIQVSDGKKTYVIDCRHVNPQPLIEAISEVETVIAHGGDFEWRWIYHHYGIELDNIKDTLLLSRVLACGDMSIECGLGAVSEREFGIELDKEMQRADWSIEELTKRHLDYAAMNAHILPALYAKLTGYLTEKNLERVAAIENASMPSVARMKLEGMPVDVEA